MSHSLSLLFVAIGGAIGAVSRHQMTLWCQQWFGSGFPYAILLLNVVGSFLIGLLMSALTHQFLISAYWRPLIAVGFLGALTTFSTFSMDTLLLFSQAEWLKAFLNVVLHLVLCLIAVTLGYMCLARGHS